MENESLGIGINLPLTYHTVEEYRSMEQVLQENLQQSQRINGEFHSNTIHLTFQLSEFYENQMKYTDQVATLWNLYQLFQRRNNLSPDPQVLVREEELENYLQLVYMLGMGYSHLQNWEESERFHKEYLLVSKQRKKCEESSNHPMTLTVKKQLADLYFTQEKYALSIPLYENWLQHHPISLFSNIPSYHQAKESEVEERVHMIHHLAYCYCEMKKYLSAEDLLQTQFSILRKLFEAEANQHPLVILTMTALARTYSKQQEKLPLSESLFEQIYEIQKSRHGKNHLETWKALVLLVRCSSQQSQKTNEDCIESYIKELLSIYQNNFDQFPADAVTALMSCFSI